MGFHSGLTHFQEVGHLSKSWLTQIDTSWLICKFQNVIADLSYFELARCHLKHIQEEGPTHYSKVGRISGCTKILCLSQNSNHHLALVIVQMMQV